MHKLFLSAVLLTLVGSCTFGEPHVPPSMPVRERERFHLPTECRPFYNDSTGRWAECMGVGPK